MTLFWLDSFPDSTEKMKFKDTKAYPDQYSLSSDPSGMDPFRSDRVLNDRNPNQSQSRVDSAVDHTIVLTSISQRSHILTLPEEVLSLIFSYFLTSFCPESEQDVRALTERRRTLYTSLCVCKKFHPIAFKALLYSPWLPSKSSIKMFGRSVLQESRAYIRQLRLRHLIITPPDCPILAALWANLQNVTVLQMRCEPWFPLGVSTVFETFPKLKVMGVYGTVDDIAGWSVTEYPGLDRGLAVLTHLDLNSISNADSWSFFKLVSSTVSSLRVLNLGRTWIDDETLSSFIQRSPLLECLWLEENPYITDTVIIEIAQTCPNLRRVKLRNCSKLSDASVTLLIEKCKNLEALGISYTNCSDKTIETISKHGSAMHTLFMNDLEIRHTSTIKSLIETRGHQFRIWSISGLDMLDAQIPVLIGQHCKQLRRLDMGECDFVIGSTISDATLQAIVNGCKKLQYFIITNISNISPAFEKEVESRYHTERFWMPWAV